MLLPALGYLNLASDYVALGTGVVRRRTLDRTLVVFLWYLFGAAITESVTIVLAHLHVLNWWILHVFTMFEYGIVMWVFSCWQTGNIRVTIRASIIVMALLWVVSKFTFENLGTADTYTQTVSSTLLLIGSGVTLFRVAVTDENSNLRTDARLWIASGVFVYTAGNLTATLLLERVVLLNFSDTMIVYQVHWALNIAVNLIFAAGYFWAR